LPLLLKLFLKRCNGRRKSRKYRTTDDKGTQANASQRV